MKHPILLFGLLVGLEILGQQALPAQTEEPIGASAPSLSLSLSEFLAGVAQNNLEYAAQRYNVSISEAQVAKAKVFPNPTLAVGASRDATRQDMPSTVSLGLTQTFLTAGKRKAGIEVAEHNYAAAAATLEDFFRNLRADATNAVIDALAARLIVVRKKRTSEALDRLVEANEKRFRAGDLSETDVTQSRVEALQFHSELLAAEATLQTAEIALSQFLGKGDPSMVVTPVGSLEVPAKTFVLGDLEKGALEKRSDVVSARQAVEACLAGVKLAKANRVPDIDLGLSWQRNFASNNLISPSPQFDQIGLSVSIALPVFNALRAELTMAQLASEQTEKNFQATRLKADIEVRQAFARYQLATARMATYKGAALKEALSVLEAKLYGFQRGQVTLLEVLNAQREENNVYLTYYDALTEYAKALVTLEQAAGIWDINF